MNKFKNRLSWIVVALIVTVVVAVIVAAMCSSDKTKPTSDEDTVTTVNENKIAENTTDKEISQSVPDDSESDIAEPDGTGNNNDPDAIQPDELSQSEVLWGEEKDTQTLNTPSFSLIYPTEWEDIFEVSETATQDLYSVSFLAKGEFEGVRIFTIYFGETTDQNAYLLGSVLSNDGERINVYHSVNMSFDDFNDDQKTELYALQGYINDILIQIQQHSSFERV